MTCAAPLADSAFLHHLLVEQLTEAAVVLLDTGGRIISWNPGAEALLGYSGEDVLGEPYACLFLPTDREQGEPERELRTSCTDGRATCTRWLLTKDMTMVWVTGVIIPLRDADGRILGFGKVIQDLTARRRAEETQARLAAIVESSDAAIVSTDPNWTVESWNPAAERLFGYTADEIVGRSILDLVPNEQKAEAQQVVDRVRAGDHIPVYEAERLRKDGQRVPVTVNPWPVRDSAGAFLSLAAIYSDLTERHRASAAIRDQEELLRNIITHIPCGVFWKNRDSVYLGCNDQVARDHGLDSPEQIVGKSDEALVRDPDEAAFYRQCDQKVLETGEALLNVEESFTKKDGRRTTLLTSKVPLTDANGTVVGVIGVYQDITDRKLLEEQLIQSQKMDAVGQLAAGVAHDFNNLLTVINGYSELIRDRLSVNDPTRDLLAEIASAGERAASLTRQLLAFSHKQVLVPKVLDLNTVVGEMGKMLQRVIGEDIDLATSLQPNLGRVKADPGQLEQVLMNLVVNARDAMPRGGKLTVETREVELDESPTHPQTPPGRYVMLAVSDTGCGMTEEVKRHLFEPFFTTKPIGKGTGLGLATVYGIVKQSGGLVEVYSEKGRGSAFKVFLPRIDSQVTVDARSFDSPVPQGMETILIAEDDPRVRMLTALSLRDHGYVVLEAVNGEDAVRVANSHGKRIHLFVTDVVMPGLGGREAADRIKVKHPNMNILFVSGYTDDAVVRHGVLEAHVEFLQKPFTPLKLAQKVREVLDREAAAV